MKIKKRRKFMVSLILVDLINTKLVHGLIAMQLPYAEQYFTDVGNTVMNLMKFTHKDQNELVYTYYQRMLERGKYVSLNKGYGDMENLAKEIYDELLAQKPIKF